MFSRGVALLGLVALSPAHASLIEYSFTSTINIHEDFGVEVGDTITGGLLFDDAAELQAPDSAEWGYGVIDRGFGISFADGPSIDGLLDSITKTPTSVPEPGTLSLLAAGALSAFAARRRRRAAA
jgi:PEP-CTERM motif-containing protein